MDKKEIKRYIDEVKADAVKRDVNILTSPSWFTDDEWRRAGEIARKRGPLSDVEMMMFKQEHDSFACGYFLNFFFELERLYSIINRMAKDDGTQ